MSVALGPRDRWQDFAACSSDDAELFYPPLVGERKKAKLMRERRAKNVCDHCDVRSHCLDYALEHGERYGIWGGLNDAERRGMLPRAG